MKTVSLLALVALAGVANAQVFTNPTPIVIPTAGSSGPSIPSDIVVAGVGAGTTSVMVTLNNISHTFIDDLDILLVGPGGNVLLLSDAGGATDFIGNTISFLDGSPVAADGAAIPDGTYGPTNYGTGDTFTAPGAPVGPYGTSIMAAAGGFNGTYTLYIQDDVGGDVGVVAGGYTLTFVPAPGALALLGLGGLVVGRRRR